MFRNRGLLRALAELSPRARFAWAALLALAVLAGQVLLRSVDEGKVPFLLFNPAIVFAAAAFGIWPAMLVYGTGLLFGLHVFMSAALTLAGPQRAALLAYAVMGFVYIYLGQLGRIYAGRAMRAERQLVADRLAQSEARRAYLHDLLLQAPGFVAVLRGPEHVIELTNEAFDELVGRRDLTGRVFRAAVPELAGQALMAHLDEAFRTGGRYSARDTEVLVRPAPGAAPRTHFIDFALQPTNTGAEVTGVFIAGVDVTARKLARDALLLNEERLKDGLQAARMAVWDCDLATEQVHFSDSAVAIFGASLDVLRQPWHLLHPDDVPRLRLARERALAERGTYLETVRARRADTGAELWIEVRGRVLTDQAGVPRTLRGVTIDVTLRHVAELGLREAERRKDEFLAMLAHELRNPLAPISAAATMLQHPGATPPQVERASAIIGRQAAHMVRLVDDLLDAARISRGKVELRYEPFDLALSVEDAVEQVRPLLERKGHVLTVRGSPQPLPVDGDRARLTQVVANLLNNAARYTPDGGAIEVALAASATSVHVTVSDNGCGIAPALLPGVFDMFTQGQRGRDRTQGGLGIGLAIVHGLVRMHGGRVAAFSDGAGQGARFEVTLPLALPRAGGAALSPHGAAARQGPQEGPPPGTTVLVVDDNRDAADTLAALLHSHGMHCTVEYGAVAALQRAVRERPRVCILDIGLPDMDGIELARQLRQRLDGPLLLLAQSGYGQAHDRAAGLAAGFDHYFVKPVALETLLAVLAQALQPGAAQALAEP
ncbi:hybrid sensor histidine kinase/response regulator [Pseudoduganella armeniaca]|uniref:histidine kinase n=1 Tax=Pseudoduganella armeniaca TaxID=2072590 RepID=A0A2R4CB45_9BURK|nr:ATP-binding protein [Pseudoduganella armeniaca]AVR96815.1 diguanylate cyclase [Pseudoduganella armeniaca]